MARQQTLQTTIVLSGNVDNSFGVIGRNLLALGSQVDALSSKLIDFGSRSLKDYINYDDIIREVQALGEYDRQTIKLLTEYNKGIARTSKYTMQQSAQAEVLMGQLGMDIKETKELMPEVMDLATAAKIEMAESLDYLYYSLNSLDKPITYAGTLADQMAKTAAISAADIDTLGASLQRLGSNAKFFTGGSTEILAILGGISQFGSDMQGAEAGTQLRNFMLTLLAPTQSKQKLLDTLQVTEDELYEFEAYLEEAGIDLTETAAAMDALGFSVYDQQGQLKSAIQIITELEGALSGLSEAERNTTLGQLFGKRTTTTALNLMGALGTINEYQDLIANHSAGYAKAMAETMEGGLGGAARQFRAAAGVLSYTVGEQLAPAAQTILETGTNVINTLSDTDAETLAPIVKGLSALALTGPMIKLAGGAFMLLGRIFTPGGAIATAIPLLISGVAYLKELNRQSLENDFGDMALDMTELSAHVSTLGTEFDAAYSEITGFSEAVDEAAETYKNASSELSGKLFTAMLTGATLTEADKDILYGLGDEMHSALVEGITNSTASSMSYWEMLFGGAGVAEYDEDYRDIIGVTNSAYEAALNTANEISQSFRAALTSAFADGKISDDEYLSIKNYMDAYNDAMAQAAEESAKESEYVAYKLMLHKAQTASLDDVQALTDEIMSERESTLTDAESRYLDEYYRLEYRGASQEALDAAAAEYEGYAASIAGRYDSMLYELWDTVLSESGHANAWNFINSDRDLSGYSTTELENLLMSLYELGNDPLFGESVAGMLAEYADSPAIAGIISDLASSSALQEMINRELDARARKSGQTLGGTDEYGRSKAERIGSMSQEELIDWIMELDAEIQTMGVSNSIREIVLWEEANAQLDKLIGAEIPFYDLPGLPAWYTDYLNTLPEFLKPSLDTGIIGEAREMGEQARAAAYEGWGDVELRARITYTGSSAANGFALYADGGRATEASIFGEAGPEWAIPEAHTQRVAQLLDAARAGAGFTWPELIARNGGLNAGGGSAGQIIYMPTIIANDATGVEEKLREDKDRLEKWYSEREMKKKMGVYA